ncbi:hypothetical protein [Catellatospora tritici]|uniref:hypothetical protein n=1 Tax=Catellatospora tritici TaxID=2851566 RepID=UPI001C2D075F|nr:hypothetical protein [Catellatospora tritici]MBV1853933.1 hypothetical protein [Catellatospora tritici]
MLRPPRSRSAATADSPIEAAEAGSRRRTFAVRAAWLGGPLTAMTALTAVSGTVGLPHAVRTGLVVVAFGGAIVLVGHLCGQWANRALLVVTLVAVGLGAVGISFTAPLLVLRARGESITVVVRSEERVTPWLWSARRHQRNRQWRYELATADGHPLPGEIVLSEDEWDVSDRVVVVYDPAGQVEPQPPDALDDIDAVLAFFAATAGAGVLLGLVTVGWGMRPGAEARLRAARAERATRSKRRAARTWFRPLGRTRRILGRAWLAFGLAVLGAGIAGVRWGAGDHSGASGAVVGGWFGVVLGLLTVLLSRGPAFGRDTRTR